MIKSMISSLLGDPVSAWDTINNLRTMPLKVRDGIFLECFQVFLLNIYEFDLEKQEFVDQTLKSFVVSLAEASPNAEASYDGNEERTLERNTVITIMTREEISEKVTGVKRFNTTAVCIPSKHYMVDISDKVAEIKKMVDDGKYFTINRARQYGKTTTLSALHGVLENDAYVAPIINGTGTYDIEPQTRDHRRMDLVIHYLGRRYSLFRRRVSDRRL